MRSRLIHASIAALPLLLTPALFFMLAEGWLDLGGGDKDILATLPYFLWALIFFIAALLLIVKGWPLRRWLPRSGFVSLGAMLVLYILVYIGNRLGFL